MGSVICRPWKIYDWVTDRGDRYPVQNGFARTTCEVLMVIGAVYCKLDAIGSLPSVVYRMTVPTGAPSGSDRVSLRVCAFSKTRPGSLNTTSPKRSLQVDPQLVPPGVGIAIYPHVSLPSVLRP